MADAVVGYTGFVGSNLINNLNGDVETFNSKNIDDIEGKSFGVLYISAIQAKKWWANQNSLEDKKLIDDLLLKLRGVSAKRVVLISTVDVYQPPLNANEDTVSDADIHPYGFNRLYAEESVRRLFETVHIVRLQGLVANNLSKNVIFDLKNKNMLESINQNSSLQWYPLDRLGADLNIVIANNIPLINLSVEPLLTKTIVGLADLSDEEKQLLSSNPSRRVSYDVKSKYDTLFGGENGYIVSAEESLMFIKAYLSK